MSGFKFFRMDFKASAMFGGSETWIFFKTIFVLKGQIKKLRMLPNCFQSLKFSVIFEIFENSNNFRYFLSVIKFKIDEIFMSPRKI